MRLTTLRGILLSATLVTTSAFAFAQPLIQTAGQDMHTAGHDTKDAAVNTGHATKRVSKKAYRKTKHGTKKAYHATAHGTHVAAHDTKVGAEDVGHDTKVGAEKTGHGIHKLGDKIAGKPTPQ